MQWFSGKRHAGKLARVVWEGGNGKGLEDTSPVPYFIRRGATGKGLLQDSTSPVAYST
jgi:hypothetical protein